ncbi:MAG: hypothetical protein WA182_06580 [Candidatus Sulfotelmatobacter sp.]
MKAKLDPMTTPEQKMQHFNKALGNALRVSKDELNERIAGAETIRRAHKRKPGPRPRHSSTSGHASDSET